MIRLHINPGHGGKDPGASRDNIREKDITLQVAQKVYQLLAKRKEFSISMTRTTDVYIPVSEIAAIANKEKADLFISIHVNCATSASASGIETLVYRYEKENKKIGDKIQQKLIQATGFVNRGVKERPDLIVLNSTKMPAALIELGFLSNAGNAFMLKKDSFLETCAKAIYQGICAYYAIEEEEAGTGIPEWQTNGLNTLIKQGVIADEKYWQDRMRQSVTVGELVGLLGKSIKG